MSQFIINEIYKCRGGYEVKICTNIDVDICIIRYMTECGVLNFETGSDLWREAMDLIIFWHRLKFAPLKSIRKNIYIFFYAKQFQKCG